MPLKDNRGIKSGLQDRRGISTSDIADEISKTGLSLPNFRLPERPTSNLSAIFSEDTYSPIAEPNINDIYKRVFSDLNNPFAPSPEEAMQEPAIEPLTFEQQYPGLTSPEVVGYSSGPSIGSQPVFAGGGAVFPMDIVNARKRTIEAAAFRAQEKKQKIKDNFYKLANIENGEQFDSQIRGDVVNFMNNTLNDTANKYFAGNYSEAANSLMDPTNSKYGQPFLKKMAGFESIVNEVKNFNPYIKKLKEDFLNNNIELTDKEFTLMNQYASGLYDISEWIDHPEKFDELKSKIQGGVAINKAINQYLQNFKAEEEAFFKKIENFSPDERVHAFEQYKVKTWSDQRIKEASGDIYESGHYEQTGAATQKEIEQRMRTKLGKQFQIMERSIKTFTDPKKAGAGSAEAIGEIYTDIYKNLNTNGKLQVVKNQNDKALTSKEAIFKSKQEIAELSGGRLVGQDLWRNTLTFDRTPPVENFSKQTNAHSSKIFIPFAPIYSGKKELDVKGGAPEVHRTMNSVNEWGSYQIKELNKDILRLQKEGGNEKEIETKRNRVQKIISQLSGSGYDISVKPTKEYTQYGYFNDNGIYIVPTDEEYEKDSTLIYRVKPYILREYNVLKPETDEGVENEYLPNVVYEVVNISDKAIAATLGMKTYGSSAETKYSKLGENQFEY